MGIEQYKGMVVPLHYGQGFQPIWQVISVHDGDTMRVRQGEKIERIRMACIDAPELKQPLGKESRDYLKSLIQQNGDRVTLKIVDTARYGRQVAEVFAGGSFLQQEQVRAGLAYHYAKYSGNCPHRDAIVTAEAIARSNRVEAIVSSEQKTGLRILFL